jgi:hypothetical protein
VSEIVVTAEWLELVLARLGSPKPHGFREECRVLAREVKRLSQANDDMRRFRAVGDFDPNFVAAQCEYAAKAGDSSLHEVAALVIRRLAADAETPRIACPAAE